MNQESMKLIIACCAAAFLLPITAFAEDITLTDGTTYHNTKITNQDAATVTIKHSTGIAHVMISLLPKELRDKLHYDPDEARKLIERERASVAQGNATVPPRQSDAEAIAVAARQSDNHGSSVSAEEWEKQAVRVTGTLFQVTDDGVIIKLSVGGQLVFVKHADSDQFIDGDVVTVSAIPCKPYRYVDVRGGTRTVRAFDATRP